MIIDKLNRIKIAMVLRASNFLLGVSVYSLQTRIGRYREVFWVMFYYLFGFVVLKPV